jgi:two-component system osmolarity sensor histidine kinase EnvZ
MILWPRSLLARTVITIAATMIAFMLILVCAAVFFVYNPLAKRHADDFAAVIVSAAHSLQSLPEDMHADLKERLLQDHGLIIAEETKASPHTHRDLPYYPFFHEAIDRRAGTELTIIEPEDSSTVWVDVPAHGKVFRIGFDKERLGTNPPLALILAVAGGALLTLIASVLQVRRVVDPIEQLSSAVRLVSRGRNPGQVPEEGPEEIAELAHAFNRMSSELKQLSENRTVMISGVSHDLRTPLTRLGIAVEMLNEDEDPKLLESIRRNLETMNKLIGQLLQFSHGAEGGVPIQLDLWMMIESLAADEKIEGSRLRLHRHNPPCVYFSDPVALERVLGNLLRNAVEYSGDAVDVHLSCSEEKVEIEICDRGPGIPEDQVEAVFRPFHRLEKARGTTSGGSGLGLSIARQIALKNDWQIHLLPRNGGGTVARLCLPATRRFSLCGAAARPEESVLAS